MKKKHLIILTFLILIFGNILMWEEIARRQSYELKFFSVGQGDAILIQTPYGHNIVVDGGPDDTLLQKLGDSTAFWDREIDLMVLTHPHSDHMGGLIHVADIYNINQVAWSGSEIETTDYAAWRDVIRDVSLELVGSGQEVSWKAGSASGLSVLHPEQPQDYEDVNEASTVMMAELAGRRVLLTGDISVENEQEILQRGYDVSADILQAPHHGSNTSSSSEFIDSVNPVAVVMSAGEGNRYGHPHEEVVMRYLSHGVHVLRTDLGSDVVFRFSY